MGLPPPARHGMKRFIFHTLIAGLLWSLMPTMLAAQDRHALVVAGLGGSADHRRAFQTYLFDTQKALTETYGFGEVVVLAEAVLQDLPFVDGVSMAEEIQAQATRLAASAGEEGTLYIILYGHGSFDGDAARLNIPRRERHDGGCGRWDGRAF